MRAVMDDPNLSNNWAIIRALLDDLSAEAWLTPPPLDLVAAVQERHDDMRRKQGERLLRVLNPQLQRVVADNNLEGAEDLAAQAEGVVKDYGIPKKSPLALPLSDTLDWIDSEYAERRKKRKQFEAAVEQFARASRTASRGPTCSIITRWCSNSACQSREVTGATPPRPASA